MAGGRVSTNNFSTADWIVDGSGIQNGATHTTITAALAASSSGDSIFVRPGTYTEDITLPAGVSITGTAGSDLNALTIINGKITQTATGNSNVSNIRFTQNGDVCIDIGGSGIIQTSFSYCSFFFDAASCLTVNNSSGNPAFWDCYFNQVGVSRAIYVVTAGNPQFFKCIMFNGGFTPGVSTIASGGASLNRCSFQGHQFTTSSTGTVSALLCTFSTEVENITIFTTAGTGTQNIRESLLRSGSASTISVGAGTTVEITGCQIDSTNTNPITGAGTISYDAVLFSNTGRTINTTSKTARNLVTGAISFDHGVNYLDYYEEGTWTPAVTGSTAGPTVTYTAQLGGYTRVGDMVTVKATIVINTFSGGTGNLHLTGLPFNVSTTNGSSVGTLGTSGVDYQAGTVEVYVRADNNASAFVRAFESNDNGARAVMPVTALAAGDIIDYTVTYWV